MDRRLVGVNTGQEGYLGSQAFLLHFLLHCLTPISTVAVEDRGRQKLILLQILNHLCLLLCYTHAVVFVLFCF